MVSYYDLAAYFFDHGYLFPRVITTIVASVFPGLRLRHNSFLIYGLNLQWGSIFEKPKTNVLFKEYSYQIEGYLIEKSISHKHIFLHSLTLKYYKIIR